MTKFAPHKSDSNKHLASLAEISKTNYDYEINRNVIHKHQLLQTRTYLQRRSPSNVLHQSCPQTIFQTRKFCYIIPLANLTKKRAAIQEFREFALTDVERGAI